MPSNPLTSCREGQCFPYSHLCNMDIMLTDVGSSSLGYKLTQVMAVISLFTFKFGSSFPAKANKSVVFPELGRPYSNDNLENT